jgi:fermentation-respiration switch protein FrsA (DUF1100 family)
VRCPLLIIAGEQDQVVPPAHSRRLYEAASNPKQFELIPGADCNDLELLTGSRLIDRVVRFTAQALGRDHPQPAGGGYRRSDGHIGPAFRRAGAGNERNTSL